MRADETVALDGDALGDERERLDLAAIADDDVVPDPHMAVDGAVVADHAVLDIRQLAVPDGRSFSNLQRTSLCSFTSCLGREHIG